MKRERKMPVGVKVVAIYTIIISILALISGITLLINDRLAEEIAAQQPDSTQWIAAAGYQSAFIGLVGGGLGIGLWKGYRWGRIGLIVFYALSIVGVLSIILFGTLVWYSVASLLINGAIIAYLACDKGARHYFAP